MTVDTMERSLLAELEDGVADEDPGRHRNLERICGLMEEILHGRAADALLAAGISEGPARIMVLPAWDWRKTAMDIGRKSMDRGTGRQLLMPVRLDWGGNENLVQVLHAAGPVAPQHWTAVSMGWSDSGTLDEKGLASRLAGPVSTRHAIEKALTAISNAGNDAMWQLVLGLEQFVESTVQKAHSAISHDVGTLTGKVQNVLHETGVEQIVNRMMFGSADGDETASVMRMLNLCMEPTCFERVDPMRYMHFHLRRDAEQEVRKAIGDPRIGSKIRRTAVRLAEELGRVATLEELVEEYRIEYPNDRLSLKRAAAALSVNSDPMARSVMLDPETNRRLV